MAITRSRTKWTGTEAGDLDEYLRALSTAQYPIDRCVHASCPCGHAELALAFDADEGCARRSCTSCGTATFVCDSEDSWGDAEPKELRCKCRSRTFDVAVGFSHREDGTVRWITVGARCCGCGMLGAPVDWKIDYAPTNQLYAQV